MNEFFTSGTAIDLVLAVVAIEAIVLAIWFRRIDLLVALLPGALLMLALRAALTGAGWEWVAILVTASLPAHLWDMRRRLSQ